LWDSTASTKEDIVGILVESPKITKEKISAVLKPVGSASKTKVTEKERKTAAGKAHYDVGRC
jgi:hypothetical protein